MNGAQKKHGDITMTATTKHQSISAPITIYNDGEICIHYFDIVKIRRLGSIQRVHGEIEQATREQFLLDLPVNQEFLDEFRQDPKSWKDIQNDIAETLRSRHK